MSGPDDAQASLDDIERRAGESILAAFDAQAKRREDDPLLELITEGFRLRQQRLHESQEADNQP